MNPSNRDSDALPEASNAQVVHIAHPLSRSSLGKGRDEPLRGIFKIDPNLMHRKIEDMEEGASSVKENIALNRAIDDLRFKTDPAILKLFPKPKSVDSGTLKNLFKLRESNSKLPSTDNSPKILRIAPAFKKIPEFKLSPTLKKISESKPLEPINLTVPKWSLSKSWKQINDLNDSNTSPSNLDKQFVEVTRGRNVPKLGLPSLMPLDLSVTQNAPFALKNLLKLKDVELMSPRTTNVKIELPFFKPVTNVNDKMVSSPVNEDCDIEHTSVQSNVQLIPRGKKAKTEILDALPSASENNHVITANGNSLQPQDGLSYASENDPVINADKNSLEQQDSLLENTSADVSTGTGQQFTDNFEAGATNTDEIHAELNQNEHTSTQQLSKIPEGGEQDFDSFGDSFEIIIDNNGASGTDQIIFDIGSEPFNSKINIGDESISEKEEVTEKDIGAPLFSEGSNFGGVVNGNDETITDHAADPDSFLLEKETEKEKSTLDVNSVAKCSCEAKSIPENDNQFMEESRNAETLNQEESPKRNMLPNLKKSLVLRLHNRQKPNGRLLSLSRLTKQNDKNKIENNERSSLDEIFAAEKEPTKTTIVEKSVPDSDDGISTMDLQDISDSSLHQSYTDQDVRNSNNFQCKANLHRAHPNDPTQSNEENETFIDNSNENIHVSDSETLESTPHTDIIETVSDLSVPFEQNQTNANDDVANVVFNTDVAQKNNKEPPCQRHTDSFESATSDEAIGKLTTEFKPQEMAVEASEHRASIFPLLTQEVLEPSSLFHSSILNPPVLPNLGDLLNGTPLPPVPSLDDITSSISDLFKDNERAANDEELTISEFDPNSDCTDDNDVMSTDASTSIISGLQNPFENINLDIFHLRPLFQSSPLTYKIPSLNLNSFKTKLAVPKTLDIRPVKLQSSLGKDGSLLGATLTFGSSNLEAQNARKSLFKSSALNRKPSVKLGNPLGNFPDLEELRSNAENLLSTPLSIPILDPLETLEATKTLGDNIRSHTENTVRNLQHSLASTLNEARTNNVGEKLAKPDLRVDLIEMVSNAHEDMKDKLYGIHTDLKDRLETLQDHITEQTNLPTLTMPRLPNVLKLESPFSETTTSNNLKASQPSKFIKSQRNPGFRANKPSQKSSTGQEKPVNQKVNLKPFKMSKAASSLTPKSVEVPKLTVTSVKPPFAKPLERNSNVKLRKIKLISDQEPTKFVQKQRPLLNLAQNGLSAGSSSSRPVSFKSKSSLPISSVGPLSTQENERSISKLLRPKSQSTFDFEDTSGFASEVRSSRIQPNTRPKNVFSDPDSTQLRSRPWQKSSVSAVTDKTVSVPNFKDLKVREKPPAKLPEFKLEFPLPKHTESPLIAKLRESLKPKLSRPKLRSEGIQLTNDMAKSASQDNAVILSQEPMKENVSYKCKMLCYREP